MKQPRLRHAWPGLVLAACLSSAALACPGDAEPRSADTLLVLRGLPGPAVALGRVELAALPGSTLVQQLSVQAAAAPGAAPPMGANSANSSAATPGATASAAPATASSRSVSFGGVLLRDLLLQHGHGGQQDRGARTRWVEAVATDGYRAVFSWGELFNSPAGDQVLVVSSLDGRPLDASAGPLALRALGDLRPGPRHVRNLCALHIRP